MNFVETFATQQLLPPFSAKGVTVHLFLFKLDPKAVQAYCDRFLNLGKVWERPFHYVATTAPLGVLAITRYPCIAILRKPGQRRRGPDGAPLEWDRVRQNELYAAAPVLRYRVAGGGALVDPELQWVQPFLINDNGSAAFSGREVLGLETLLGSFRFAPPRGGRYDVEVRLPSWKVFNWDSPQEDLQFLQVHTGPALARDDALALLDLKTGDAEAVAALKTLGELLSPHEKALGQAMPSSMKMVILKQFREAGDPSKAIYQALVNGRCGFSNIALEDAEVYDPKACRLEFTPGAMVDEMIATLLDLSKRQAKVRMAQLAQNRSVRRVRLEVVLAVKFDANLVFDAIETVHRF
jgi:hypothetical protein